MQALSAAFARAQSPAMQHHTSHVAIRHATCTHRTGEKTLRATHAAIHACACIKSRLHTRTRSHARTHLRGAFYHSGAYAHCTCVVQCFCATVGVAGLTTRSFRGSTWRRLQPQSHGPTAAMAERTATRCQRCLSAVGRFVLGACGDYRLHGACRRPWRHSYRMLCERCKHR